MPGTYTSEGKMGNKYKSSATVISLDEAVGKVLAHDITEIRPGQFKGPAFKKGYMVREEDLDHLRRLGKEHLYVLHMRPDELHEDDAAVRLARALAAKVLGSNGARQRAFLNQTLAKSRWSPQNR